MKQPDTFSSGSGQPQNRGNLSAYLVLAVSLSLTLLGWSFVSRSVKEANNAAFKSQAAHIKMMLHERIDFHESALRELVDLISVMGYISKEKWDAFLDGLSLSNWRPGLVGVGLIKREKTPDGAYRHPITYATGYVKDGEYFLEGGDLADHPPAMKMLENVLVSNFITFSDPVNVTIEGKKAQGYHIFFPILKKGVPASETTAGSRLDIDGLIAGLVTFDGLFESMSDIDASTMKGITVEVYDGEVANPDRLVGKFGPNSGAASAAPSFEYSVIDEIGNRNFLLRFTSTSLYNPGRDESGPLLTAAGGALVSFLLFGITLTLTHTRSRAYALAEEMAEAKMENEARYRKLFSHGIDAIYIFDAESARILDVNGAFLKMFGYTMEEALTLHVHDICAAGQSQCDLISNLSGKGEAFFPLRHQRKKDGTVFPVEMAAAGFRLEGRKVMFALVRDITERLRAEEEIRTLKNFYSSILETVLTGVIVTGPDGVINFANSAMISIAGVPTEKILGLDVVNGLDGESKAGFLPIYMEAMRSLRPAYFDGLNVAAEGWRKSWLSGWIAPIINNGEFVGIIITAEDITEKKLAQQALKESEERFKTLTEVAEEGIAISESGVLMDVNPTLARMCGYQPPEMIGREILDFVDKESKDYVLDLMARGWDKPYEAVVVRKDGVRFPVEVIGKYGVYRGKSVLVASIRDITERRKAADELYKAKEKAEMSTRLKDKFVSLVAHDLRSPFTSILGMLALLEAETDPPLHPSHRVMVRRIQETGENLVTMISNLLSISRLQTGKITPRKRFIDGQMITGAVIAGLSHLAAQKGVKVINAISAGHRIYADPDLLQEALRNLLSNAIKFSKAGDEVSVYAPAGDKAAMAVRDTGVGIRSELIPNLFRHEEKTSTIGTAGELGTGLGLPLTHDVIEAHGGALSVESEEGNGSVFTIALPFARPLVLIVDDEPEMRMLMRMRMEALDADVIEAGSVDSAMGIVKSREINLVITDVFMPVKDGFELLTQIRSLKGRDMPILVMTSDSRMETREKAFRLGADDFVNKPIVPSDIIPRARRLLMGGL